MGALLLKVIGISLSGVLAPGPLTAATVEAGVHRRHAGALVALGHALIEFPLALLVLAGVGRVLQQAGVRLGIGLAGGAFLLLMGAQMLGARASGSLAAPPARHPLVTGLVLTGANPYFLLWWATVGLALATQAAGLGALAFAIFVVVHWVCDLVWLEVLSTTSHRGAKVIGERGQQVVRVACGAAMLLFGVLFLRDAVRWLYPS